MNNLVVPPGSHAAREYMLALGREMPHFWKACAEVRKTIQHTGPQYLSDGDGAQAFVEATFALGGEQALNALRGLSELETSRLISSCTTLACWRMTQGVYRIDPAVYAALIDTPLTSEIPTDVLLRLPEWCIYVETPGLRVMLRDGLTTTALRGAFVRIDSENDLNHLVIGLDMPEAQVLQTQSFVLTPGKPMRDAVFAAIVEWYTPTPNSKDVDGIWLYVGPIINLLLYICSTADIRGRHGAPGNPVPVRTRRDGLRLFAPDAPRTWDVGVRMGAALRAAYQVEETGASGGEHNGPRPHVRRAHWHGFRSGPRKQPDGTEIPTDARKFELRWLPPILVNVDDALNLPTVIRVLP